MPDKSPKPLAPCANAPRHGEARPMLAVACFGAAFAFAGLPFALHSDGVAIVSTCAIACCTATIVFLRLVVGRLGILKHLLLVVPAILACAVYAAGQEWRPVAIITGGTILCSYLLIRTIGDTAPLARNVRL